MKKKTAEITENTKNKCTLFQT